MKLSYRRDNAYLRSLCLSRSFKVIDLDANRKPVCDFILVNTNLHHLAPGPSYRTVFGQIIAFYRGGPLPNAPCFP